MLGQEITEVINLRGYTYSPWYYQHGHSMLVVRAYIADKPADYLYIVFHAVSYMQMPVSWSQGDFRLGTSSEFSELMKMAGFDDQAAQHLTLFIAQTPNTQVRILCHRVSVTNTSPL